MRWLVASLLLFHVPPEVSGQQVNRVVAIRRFAPGTPVRVVVAGRRQEGTFLGATDASIQFLVSRAPVSVAWAAIDTLWSVRRRESGATVTGGILGVVGGGILGWAIGSGSCGSVAACRGRLAPAVTLGAVLGGAIGAGGGWLLDRADRGWVREWP